MKDEAHVFEFAVGGVAAPGLVLLLPCHPPHTTQDVQEVADQFVVFYF